MPEPSSEPAAVLGTIEIFLASGQTVTLTAITPEQAQAIEDMPAWLRNASGRLFIRGSYTLNDVSGKVFTIPSRHIVAISYTPASDA